MSPVRVFTKEHLLYASPFPFLSSAQNVGSLALRRSIGYSSNSSPNHRSFRQSEKVRNSSVFCLFVIIHLFAYVFFVIYFGIHFHFLSLVFWLIVCYYVFKFIVFIFLHLLFHFLILVRDLFLYFIL